MFKSWRIIACLTLVMLMGVLPTFAQTEAAPWMAYLYNGQTKDLVRVGQDGQSTTINLGLDDSTFISGFDMAFTADGSKVAFCSLQYTEGSTQSFARLTVRDLVQNVDALLTDLGSSIGCRTGHYAFSPDQSLLAVSKVNYFPGDPAADTTQPAWQLLVLNAATGEVVHELNAQSASAVNAGVMTEGPMLPFVQSFDANQIIFAEVPYGVGGGAEWRAFSWAFGTDTLTVVPRWGNIGLDTLAVTGELIWASTDTTRPAASPGGPIPANNIVKLVDKTGEERTVYYTGDWVISDARFISGGRQIAIALIPPFDPNNPDVVQDMKWVALDRSGAVSDLQTASGMGFNALNAAPQGYVIFKTTFLDDTQTQREYTLDYVADGASQTLWTTSTSDPSQSWELAWSAPTESTTDLQSFPAAS